MWTSVAVGNIDNAFESGIEKNIDGALVCVLGDYVVVVDDDEQNY